VKNENDFQSFKKLLESTSGNEPLITAYRGASEAIEAVYVFWPLKKLDYLKKGLATIALAIRQEPNNLEIRFIRFSIVSNVPGILGFGNLLDEDKPVIISGLLKRDYSMISQKTQIGMVEYMLNSDDLTNAEVSTLKKLYSTIDKK
jgi:hypothetical protein